jgi:hypothetical protein
VLLNVALPNRCLRHGFAFEHDRDPPVAWSCGYRYRAVDAAAPFALWRPRALLCSWENRPTGDQRRGSTRRPAQGASRAASGRSLPPSRRHCTRERFGDQARVRSGRHEWLGRRARSGR